MQYRTLGRTGATVSEIGFGTWGLDAEMWGSADSKECIRSFHRALDLGVNLVDTAPAYGNGYAEQLTGRVLRDLGLRNAVHIATKVTPLVPIAYASPHIPVSAVYPGHYITASVEASLNNLLTDRIELLQLHAWDSNWLYEGDWLEALLRLKQEGKIAAIGVSVLDHEPDSAIELVRSGYIDTVQVMYNLFDQSAQAGLFDEAQAHGVGILVRSPLYEGILSGAIGRNHVFANDDWRKDYFTADYLDELMEYVDALISEHRISRDYLYAFSLRFALSHPAVSTVLAGMRRLPHVERNCAVTEEPLLDESILSQLAKYNLYPSSLTQ